MGYYLLDHPNPHGDHFHRSRRKPVKSIVVHITAGLEDLDGLGDLSAENTAAYAATTDRAVSWHSGSDADSVVELLPPYMTAFHVQGYNSSTYGHEISKAHPDWRTAPPRWIDATLRQAGSHLGPMARLLGTPLRKATKAELDRAIATNGAPVGFIGHWELDDPRRQDPGQVGPIDTFPWHRFLGACAPAAPSPAPTPPDQVEEDETVFTYKDARDNRVFIVESIDGKKRRRHVQRPELDAYIAAGVLDEPKLLNADQAAVMQWRYPEVA